MKRVAKQREISATKRVAETRGKKFIEKGCRDKNKKVHRKELKKQRGRKG